MPVLCQPTRVLVVWNGIVQNIHSQLVIKSYGKHHDGAQVKHHGVMTAEQEEKWKNSEAKTGVGKLGALAFMEQSPPAIEQSQGKLRRARKKQRVVAGISSPEE